MQTRGEEALGVLMNSLVRLVVNQCLKGQLSCAVPRKRLVFHTVRVGKDFMIGVMHSSSLLCPHFQETLRSQLGPWLVRGTYEHA